MEGRFQALDAVLKAELKEGKLKGAAMYVEQHGNTLFNEIYGSDRSDSIYKIYSMSKPITLTAVMILYERGLITLQDRVDRYIPEVRDTLVDEGGKLVPQKTVMTIQHLLDMQSGVVYPGENTLPEKTMAGQQLEMRRWIADGRKMGTVDICKVLASCPLEFHPGTGFRYGASADLLGAIVEIVSGMKFGDFLKKEIFEPLGMTDTAFLVPEEKISRLASMYHRNPETGICETPSAEQIEWLSLASPTKEPYIESGGGGLYSTMKDYAAFCRMLLNKGLAADGKTRILGRKTVELMPRDAMTDAMRPEWFKTDNRGYSYGNLLRVMTDPQAAGSNGTAGEYGWDGLPGCYFLIDPKEDLFLVYMQQIGEGADISLRRRYRAAMYGALD